MIDNPLIDIMSGVTTRRQTVIDYPASPRAAGLKVQIIRSGTPSDDMSRVEVTARVVAITLTQAGEGGGPSTEVHLSADNAADIADALDQAAATIRQEDA